MLVGELLEGAVVVGGVEDDFAFAVGLSHFIEVGRDVVGFRRVLGESGEVVVVFENVEVVRDFLVRVLVRGIGTEGAPVLRHLGTVLAVGSDHYPVFDHRVPSEFSHDIYLPLSEFYYFRLFIRRTKTKRRYMTVNRAALSILYHRTAT